MKPYIKCSELIDFIADYLTGELPPDARQEFERHLNACPPCQAYLQTYGDTIRLSRTALCEGHDHPKPTDTVPEDLVKAILAARKKEA